MSTALAGTDGSMLMSATPPRPMIHPAIIAIMREIEPIAKSQRNQQQGFNYRGVDQVYNECHPHFAKHGVYSTNKIIASEHREGKTDKGKPYLHAILKIQITFWAEDGSSVTTEVIGEGMDYSGDKASNKAMSVADKYAILQLLKIPTAAVDPDGDSRARTSRPFADWVYKAESAIIEARDEAGLARFSSEISKREATDAEREYLHNAIEAQREVIRGHKP